MAESLPEDSPFSECAYCGADFEPEVRYPVVTRGGGDEELELYSFCDEDCMSAWGYDD